MAADQAPLSLGFSKARILEWVAIFFSKACMHTKSLQSCLILCDSMDSSPPGYSVHRILYARMLEWVAISFSSATWEALVAKYWPLTAVIKESYL